MGSAAEEWQAKLLAYEATLGRTLEHSSQLLQDGTNPDATLRQQVLTDGIRASRPVCRQLRGSRRRPVPRLDEMRPRPSRTCVPNRKLRPELEEPSRRRHLPLHHRGPRVRGNANRLPLVTGRVGISLMLRHLEMSLLSRTRTTPRDAQFPLDHRLSPKLPKHRSTTK